MAATAELNGADFAITAGGTLVGGRTGGSLVLDRSLLDVTNTTSSKWREVSTLERTWRVPYQGIYVDNSVNLTGCAVFKVADDAVSSPTAMKSVSTYNLEQVKSLTISVNQDLIQISNCSNSDNAAYLPGNRSATITFTCDYQDEQDASNNQFSLFEDWENAAPKVEWVFELGTSGTGGTSHPAFSGDGYVTNLTVSVGADGLAELSGTIEVSGAVTFDDSTSGSDTGLAALIAAIIPSTPTNDPSTVAVVFGYDSDQNGTMETNSTRWSGSGYVTSLEVSMAYNEVSSVGIEVTGTGALTRATS